MGIRILLISLLFCIRIISTAQIENLVFEGAGIRGIAYCGALMEMESKGDLQGVRRVAGTSSGAITAGLLSVGYSPQEIYEIIGSTNFAKFNDGGWIFIGGFSRLKKRFGYYKGNAFLNWMEELIKNKTGNANITFEELYALAQKDSRYKELVVTAMCLNKQEPFYFSSHTYPKMSIADAIRASMAIPYYFEPVIIDKEGKTYKKKEMKADHDICVDGGFVSNFPIYIFDQPPFSNDRTIGFRIDQDEQIANDLTTRELVDIPIEDIGDFSVAFYYVIKETMNRYMLTEKDWERTVSISDAKIGPKVKKLSQEEKDLLINAGREAVRR
ncbi:MAG: patatin-like phospholipase family protein [Flavobacteriales bacterium]